MDRIILSQKTKRWFDSVKFLKEHKDLMSVEEQTALEFLTEAWRTRPFDSELKNEANEMIGILSSCDVMHGNNRDIITHSKEVRGTAKIMYTQDAATFGEFSEALRKLYGNSRPTPRPTPKPIPKPIPKPTPKPKPTPTPSDTGFVIKDIVFLNTDINCNIISRGPLPIDTQYATPELHIHADRYLGVVEFNYKIFEPDGTRMHVTDSTSPYTNSIKVTLNSGDSTVIGSGFGSTSGEIYRAGTYRFELYHAGKLIFSKSFVINEPQINGNELLIKSVTFNNNTYESKTLNTGYLPVNTQYATPIVSYYSSKALGSIQVTYDIFDPAGNRMINTSDGGLYTVNCQMRVKAGDNTYELSGFGNRQGTCYRKGRYRFELYWRGRSIYTTYFNVGSVTPQPTPRPNPTPRPTPTPRPKPTPRTIIEKPWERKKRRRRNLIVGSIIGVILIALIGWGVSSYNYYQMVKNSPSMRNIAPVDLLDKETKQPFSRAGSGVEFKLLANEGDLARVKADGSPECYVRRDQLISENTYQQVVRIIGDNRLLQDQPSRMAVLDLIQANTGIDFSDWQIRDIPERLSPNSVVRSKADGSDGSEGLAFIISRGDRSIYGVYELKPDGTVERVDNGDVPAGKMLSDVRKSRLGTYQPVFVYGDVITGKKTDVTVDGDDIAITGFDFVNTDRNCNIISHTINSRSKYVTPKIRYRVKNTGSSTNLQVKVISADGELQRENSSPAGYSYQYTFTPWNNYGTQQLTGWGNSDGWSCNGYRFEIWHKGRLLASRTVRY